MFRDIWTPVTWDSTGSFLGMVQNKAYHRHYTLHDNRINADETKSSGQMDIGILELLELFKVHDLRILNVNVLESVPQTLTYTA